MALGALHHLLLNETGVQDPLLHTPRTAVYRILRNNQTSQNSIINELDRYASQFEQNTSQNIRKLKNILSIEPALAELCATLEIHSDPIELLKQLPNSSRVSRSDRIGIFTSTESLDLDSTLIIRLSPTSFLVREKTCGKYWIYTYVDGVKTLYPFSKVVRQCIKLAEYVETKATRPRYYMFQPPMNLPNCDVIQTFTRNVLVHYDTPNKYLTALIAETSRYIRQIRGIMRTLNYDATDSTVSNGSERCAICMRSCRETRPCCNQTAHTMCVDRWLDMNPDGRCPCCRRSII